VNCFICGRPLTEVDYCTSCGTDVRMYKKIMAASNYYYNQGLEKAQVRDMSGAIANLRQSLRFNKYNIDARNLLGLCYYDTGEVVKGLVEWVVSKNLYPERNLASIYLTALQNNPTKLDAINQTIKKYNLALAYVQQDSTDLAIIQLKRVLSIHPNFLKAHQLLALLYIQSEQYDRAKKELAKCLKIDAKNLTTMRYIAEVRTRETPEEADQKKRKSNISSNTITYVSDNETIIQPVGGNDRRGVGTVFNVILGIIVGAAVACFLLIPGRDSANDSKAQEELRVVSEQLDKKTGDIADLNLQIERLNNEKEALQTSLDNVVGAGGSEQAMNIVMQAAQAYMDNPEDLDRIADILEPMDMNEAEAIESESFQALRSFLVNKVGPASAEKYASEGEEAYKKDLYEDAITAYQKAMEYGLVTEDMLYNIAASYNATGDTVNAKKYYENLIERYPDTEKAKRAQNFLEEIEGGG